MKNTSWIKVTLLLTSSMTVMSGAMVAPVLPVMQSHFAAVPSVALLTRLVLTIPALLIALTSPFSGAIVDRFGRKRLLVIALVLYGVAGTSGFYLSSLPLLLVGRALLGVAVGAVMTVSTTLIGDYFEGPARNRFMGFQAAFMAVGGTVFLTISGALTDVSWRLPFLVYGFAFVVLPLVIYVLYEPMMAKNGQEGQKGREALPRQIWWVFGLGWFSMTAYYMIPVQVPYLLKGFEGVSNLMSGLAIALSTLVAGAVSANYRALRQRWKPLPLFGISFLFMGAGYVVLSQASSYTVVMAGMFIAGLGAGIPMPNSTLWAIELAPPALRGRVTGGLTTAIFLGQFTSPILVQPLLRITNLPGTFFYAAMLLFALGVALVLPGLRKSKARHGT